jgi:hypothetical protein
MLERSFAFFSRNTISSPRRKISTSSVFNRNCFGSADCLAVSAPEYPRSAHVSTSITYTSSIHAKLLGRKPGVAMSPRSTGKSSYVAQADALGGKQSQGRFLSSIFFGDWQLFLLSSSFICW